MKKLKRLLMLLLLSSSSLINESTFDKTFSCEKITRITRSDFSFLCSLAPTKYVFEFTISLHCFFFFFFHLSLIDICKVSHAFLDNGEMNSFVHISNFI